MKELKAYIRPDLLERVIGSLEEAGARDITVIRVDVLGALADAELNHRRLVRRYAEKYSRAAKLEIVCTDEEAARFAAVLLQHAHTGASGDGRIFVTTIERALNIRTSQEGEQAL
jgi:nitrogen regulatory protein PII